jgi:hypothetical protein
MDVMQGKISGRTFHAREPGCESANLTASAHTTPFTVVFYVVKSFWCKTTQFCVTRRECEMAETPSVGNGRASRFFKRIAPMPSICSNKLLLATRNLHSLIVH